MKKELRQSKNKENAYSDYINMITKSWTYSRMTETEKEHVFDALGRATLFGTYKQRHDILDSVYSGFLSALGYFDKPADWRNPDAPRF